MNLGGNTLDELRSQDAKGRILLAVAELLKEEPDIEKITVRQIAERAGVGVGLISYHFGSKYNLLTEAIDRNVYSTVEDFISKTKGKHIEPIEKLKAMLKSMFNLMQSQRKTARFMLIQGIMKGEMRATLYLVPLLKELFKGQREDLRSENFSLYRSLNQSGLPSLILFIFSSTAV